MKLINNKINIIVLLLSICFFVTGCWDKVEINDRAFVMGLGLDKAEDMIKATYTIPNLPVITGQGNGDEKNFVKNTEGKTLLEANSKITNIINTKITFDHTNVIVLGSSFVQDPDAIKMTFDYFVRSPEYALSLLLVTTDGEANKLLQAKPNADEPNSIYISELFQGNKSDELGKFKTTLLDFITSIEESKGVGILPVLNYKDKEIRMEGLVILKDYKKCAKLNIGQITAYNWIRGQGKGVYITEKETLDVKNISYKISQINRKVTFKKTNQGMDIKISIETEGDIIEFKLKKDEKEKNIFDKKDISEIEKVIKEGMESEMNAILDIIQKEVGADIIDLSKDFKIQEGKLWEEVKEDWEQYFSSANIQVEVSPHVRRIGMTK